MDTPLDVIQVGVQEVFFATLIFVAVYYGLNKRWLKNVYARMIVSLDFCLMLLDFPSCLHIWTGLNILNRFFAWYDAVSVQLTAGVILWRAYMIIKIQLTRDLRVQDEEEVKNNEGDV